MLNKITLHIDDETQITIQAEPGKALSKTGGISFMFDDKAYAFPNNSGVLDEDDEMSGLAVFQKVIGAERLIERFVKHSVQQFNNTPQEKRTRQMFNTVKNGAVNITKHGKGDPRLANTMLTLWNEAFGNDYNFRYDVLKMDENTDEIMMLLNVVSLVKNTGIQNSFPADPQVYSSASLSFDQSNIPDISLGELDHTATVSGSEPVSQIAPEDFVAESPATVSDAMPQKRGRGRPRKIRDDMPLFDGSEPASEKRGFSPRPDGIVRERSAERKTVHITDGDLKMDEDGSFDMSGVDVLDNPDGLDILAGEEGDWDPEKKYDQEDGDKISLDFDVPEFE